MSGNTGNTDPKRYWKGLEESSLGGGDGASSHHPPPADARNVGRRDFLKLSGFSLGAAALTGCTRGKENKIIPFLVKPEEVTPGRALWYASTCGGCPAGCGALARNRDGRPIKLEGSPDHPVSRGGLCAMGQASLLGLYDSQRPAGPLARDGAASLKRTAWEDVDRRIVETLARIRSTNGKVRFLTGTVNSPTRLASLRAFLEGFDAALVQYDALSVSALLDAHEEAYGERILPRYRFDRAEVIVSFDADFLGTWISPVEFTAGYQEGRRLGGGTFSFHAQIESRLSVTGSNADHRLAIRPADQTLVMAHLVERLERTAQGRSELGGLGSAPVADAELDRLVERLRAAPRGRTLVVCGTNEPEAQRLAAYMNHLLGNDAEGGTVDLARPSRQRQGSDAHLRVLREELLAGEVAALFVHDVDPVYDLPGGAALAAAIREVPLVVSLSPRLDDTAALAHFVCPDHHFLESWSDAEPVDGVVVVGQPAIAPLGATRSAVESLAAWQGRPAAHYEIQRAVWRAEILPRSGAADFDAFWDRSVHDGFAVVAPRSTAVSPYRRPRLAPPARRPAVAGTLELVLYPRVGMGDGRHAYNPWLQELPDPISKVTWDNYAALAPSTAGGLGVRSGDVVRVGDGDAALDLPVFVQPGQHAAVVAIALGYGNKGSERFSRIGPEWLHKRPTIEAGERVGRNAAALLSLANGYLAYSGTSVPVAPTGGRRPLATTQQHDTLEVPEHLAAKPGERRPLVQEATLEAYRSDPASGSHPHHDLISLWPRDHTYDGHHWDMAIDLSRCTGCSACVVACQVENNVPVVGKDEVLREREMSWLRIDRYYSGSGDDVDVVHQPMMCQQCDHAPCENVCPVLATVHSSEGLNQQVYNRCVGTRYCANNCPYKVRRFNWFDYPRDDRLQNMVLNPDVTVRSRGVMEKCSFCVQRIQEAKAEAKREGRELRDGDIRTACQQSCPSQAIVFGDRNDPESEVAQRIRDPRHFRVLEELGVLPSVGYLTSVKDRDSEREAQAHG